MSNPYQVVKDFEKAVAEYTGAPYAVSVDSCSNGLFLCLKLLIDKNQEITIPSHTYPSVPCSIIHAGGRVKFEDIEWRDKRFYQLKPCNLYDAAHLFEKDMFIDNSFMCISFSATKPVNIGKGGMILTDRKFAIDILKQMRYCGRHEVPLMKDRFDGLGWNMYMTPEQAARGLLLMGNLKNRSMPPMPEYPDLSKYSVYRP